MGLGDLPTTSVLLNISVKWGNVVGKRNIIWRNSGASKCDTTLVRSPQASLNLAGWETTLLGLWYLSDWDNWLGLSKLSRDCCIILFTYGRYTHVYGGNILFQLPKLLTSWSHNTPRIEYVIIRLAGRHGIREKSGGRSKSILQAMKRFEELSFTHNREYLSSHQTEFPGEAHPPLTALDRHCQLLTLWISFLCALSFLRPFYSDSWFSFSIFLQPLGFCGYTK